MVRQHLSPCFRESPVTVIGLFSLHLVVHWHKSEWSHAGGSGPGKGVRWVMCQHYHSCSPPGIQSSYSLLFPPPPQYSPSQPSIYQVLHCWKQLSTISAPTPPRSVTWEVCTVTTSLTTHLWQLVPAQPLLEQCKKRVGMCCKFTLVFS